MPEDVALDEVRVDKLVEEFLSKERLAMFPEKPLTEAVSTYVEKEERDAIKEYEYI